MTDLEPRLRRCFAAVFPEVPADQIPSASTETVAQWDSIRFLTLVTVLQEEFHVTISDEEAEDLTSYDAALDFLKRHAA